MAPFRNRRFVKANANFAAARKVELQYATTLRKIAKAIDTIVKGFDPSDQNYASHIQMALARYADTVAPWAKSVARRMIADVARRDENAWKRVSSVMGRDLASEIRYAPIGRTVQDLMQQQVELITSLPIEAAQRVHQLTLKAITEGSRAKEIADDIFNTGEVTRSRATLIARTEVARTSSTLTQARAEHIGSTHYVWRTAGDADVRDDHKKLNGKAFAWDDPPVADSRSGTRANPGCIWNCFLGNERVSVGNGIRRIYRAPFQGQIIDVITTSGRMSPTLNHPILTSRGWISIGEIREGDDLIQAIDNTQFVVDADIHNANPTFEQIYEASLRNGKHSMLVEGDFHGDIPNGDVETITSPHPLMLDDVPQLLQSASNRDLPNPDRGVAIIPGFGVGFQVGESGGASIHDERVAFIRRHFPHADEISLAAGAALNIALGKDAGHNSSRDFKSLSKGQLAVTSEIGGNNFPGRENFSIVGSSTSSGNDEPLITQSNAYDISRRADRGCSLMQKQPLSYKALRVIETRIRNFEGYVYTLETETGWFGVSLSGQPDNNSGIISKNCRCYPEPLIPDGLN
jgi:SPP1 gp7 family putative phage head morphogenesis protein